MKRCGRCKETKPTSEFHRSRRLKDGLQRRCKACDREVIQEFKERHPGRVNEIQRQSERRSRAKNPERTRAAYRRYDLKRYFGISPEEYDHLLETQDGVCAICGAAPFSKRAAGRRLAVDHQHGTGEVRRLLCANCNRALGLFADSPEWLRRAADYVEEVRSWV
jgi:Autographiviridae endonuclease VII